MLSAAATEVLAICILAAGGLGLLAWAAVLFRRLPYRPAQNLLWVLNYLLTRVLWRAQITGRPLIPPHQGAVFVCNHRSPCDPAFIALTVDRPVHWMVASEFCARPAFAWLLRTCEVIPVNRRRVDTVATKLAIRYAQQGGLVGVFPEGRINTTQQILLPGRPGAALIALKARVPIVPCYLSGAPYNGTTMGCLVMRAAVHLTIGRPIDVSEYYDCQDQREALELVTRRLLSEIAKLAGQADFQPRLAGRF